MANVLDIVYWQSFLKFCSIGDVISLLADGLVLALLYLPLLRYLNRTRCGGRARNGGSGGALLVT